MQNKKSNLKKSTALIGNVLLIGFFLVVLLNKDAKALVLRGFMSVGLFNAEIPADSSELASLPQNVSFYVTDDDGRNFSIAEQKGRVVFVNFWASWCPPCRAEMPSLQALYDKLKYDDRFLFLVINEDGDPDKGRAYFEKKGYTMPFVRRLGTISTEIYNGTLPTTVIIDKEGRVVMREVGIADFNTDAFLKQLKALQ